MRRFPLALFTGLALVSAGCASEASNDTAAAAPGADSTAATPSTGFIDPNSATREQLMTLPAMDSAKAAALIAGRPYADMTQVDRVLAGAQLTQPQRMALYERLWKPLDLNKASAEEIKLIPGAGDKMAHEFDEYRPYTDIRRFRAEIAKYVDDSVVARFERYVEIRP